MATYPEMNQKIVGLLRMTDNDPTKLYAADRIEELERQCNTYCDLLVNILKADQSGILALAQAITAAWEAIGRTPTPPLSGRQSDQFGS